MNGSAATHGDVRCVSLSSRVHRPALAAVMALVSGILADRFGAISLTAWLILAGIFVLGSIALIACRRAPSGVCSLCVLAALAATGGARQHLFWSTRQADNIAGFCGAAPAAARLVGTIASSVEIQDAIVGPGIPSWMEVDRSTCRLECERIDQQGSWIPVSGNVRIDVTGHLVQAGIGDRVEVVGHVSVPGPPRNPGEFDYRTFLRAQGIDCLLRVEHPAAVTRLEHRDGPGWFLARSRESLRSACQQLFAAELRPAQRGLASSLLLGDRTLLTDELREQFAQSGAMHLLAISGLHVSILLGLVLIICRVWNLSARTIGCVLIAAVLVYAFVTDHRPPVLRAGLLASLALVGAAQGRLVDGFNTLAVSALVLLLWRPADLFDIGAQLSFLAVGAILWSVKFRWGTADENALTGPQPERPAIVEQLLSAGRAAGRVYLMTAAVWLATLPLTMASFHLAAPVGILLNIVLIPYIAVVLALGYLFLFGGLLFPLLAGWLAAPYAWSLGILQWLVRGGQQATLGHIYVPGVPVWWLAGFYVLLGLGWQLAGTAVSARRAMQGLLAWTVLGLLIAFLPARHESLRCTFLSVGHGLATVLEFPSGETLLYDAGTLGDGSGAERAVAHYLWSRGIDHVDAVIISHADHDHYSGLFGLLPKVPVGTLFIAQSFLDFEQRSIVDLCELAAAEHIPIQILQAGDELPLRHDPHRAVQLAVLHPPGSSPAKSDNANSIVLAVCFAGKRILLTGDLEKDGLMALLEQPAVHADVLLAPHHGGKAANVPALFDWAGPEYVVASSGDGNLFHLRNVAGRAQLLNTATSGAVTFEIHPDGRLSVEEFLKLPGSGRSSVTVEATRPRE